MLKNRCLLRVLVGVDAVTYYGLEKKCTRVSTSVGRAWAVASHGHVCLVAETTLNECDEWCFPHRGGPTLINSCFRNTSPTSTPEHSGSRSQYISSLGNTIPLGNSFRYQDVFDQKWNSRKGLRHLVQRTWHQARNTRRTFHQARHTR